MQTSESELLMKNSKTEHLNDWIISELKHFSDEENSESELLTGNKIYNQIF